MTQEQLERALQTIGKGCFVEFFELFADRTLSNAIIANQIASAKSYRASATRTRVSRARRILDQGLGRNALAIIASSDGVDEKVAEAAQSLLSKLG